VSAEQSTVDGSTDERNESGLNRPLALLVAATFFMENLDGTIIATAAPRIAADFGVPAVAINAAMTSYLLALAVGIQASGWLAERFGARRIFLLAIVIFTVSSGLCALSPNLLMLCLTRVLQGLGGAMMVPVGRLVVLRATRKSELLPAIAYLTWPGLVAPVIAPTVGGLIATYATWQWIFLINVPLGVLAFVVASRVVPHVSPARVPGLDWVGFALFASAAVALVLGMEQVGDAGRWQWAVAGAALALVLGFVAVRWMRNREHPLVDLSILSVATYRLSNTGGGVFRLVVSAVPFLLPLMFQEAFGWTPVKAGLMVMAVFIGNIGIKPTTTPLIRRFGFRTVILGSTVGLLLTFVGCAFITDDTPLAVTAAVLVISGAFRSIGFTAYNSVQFADIDPADLAGANTFSATVQQLAGGLGVAFGALALRVADGLGAAGSDTLVGQYHFAFAVLAVAMLFPCLETLTMARHAGAEVSGHRPQTAPVPSSRPRV
jgi:EmrB/QacA subfamily drug resistance transporter